MAPANIEALRGGDRACNAAIATAILQGQHGAQRDIVLVNSAAALLVAGVAGDLGEAMERAAESIDSGAARDKLRRLVEFSHG
jgi:anthranilate phosphoribosyltransferase